MNRPIQKKMKQPQRSLYDPHKQNVSNSQIESLLVSSLRYQSNNSYPYIESQENDQKYKTKPSQASLIRKQFSSNINVFVDDKSTKEHQCCKCCQKIQGIQQNLKLIGLKIKEFQSKLNINFSKCGQLTTKMSELQIFKQEISMVNWQQKQKIAQISKAHSKNQQQTAYKLTVISQQLAKLKKQTHKSQNKPSEGKVCFESKMLDHKLEKFKDQYEITISGIVQNLQKIGSLQNKFINQYQTNQSRACLTFPDDNTKPHNKYYRSYSKRQDNKSNQSTNISYSRNYQTNK